MRRARMLFGGVAPLALLAACSAPEPTVLREAGTAAATPSALVAAGTPCQAAPQSAACDTTRDLFVRATAGEAQAQHSLAGIYLSDALGGRNATQALHWYDRAARQRLPESLHALGYLHEAGIGIQADPEAAARYYRTAADLGSTDAQINLGALYEEGVGVPRDAARAAQWYRRAAATGHPHALANLARLHETGTGVPRDSQAAMTLYRRAAEAGHAQSQRILGIALADGRFGEPDPAEGRRWLDAASAQGDVAAATRRAEMIALGQGGPADPQAAVTLLRPLAEDGHAAAQLALGRLYRDAPEQSASPQLSSTAATLVDYASAPSRNWQWTADGRTASIAADTSSRPGGAIEEAAAHPALHRDDREALRWINLAAQQGLPEAALALGVMLHDGRGTEPDHEAAARWYAVAAESGLPEAQANLGLLHFFGRGVARDHAVAAEWFTRAAEQDDPVALFNLGILKLRGSGVSTDIDGGAALVLRAAERHHAPAQEALAVLHEHGIGVPQDARLAAYWRTRSASSAR